MFYEDYCKTDTQKLIFKAIVELSKNGRFVAVQELDYLGVPRAEVEETLSYFETKQLFESVQHLNGDCPALFTIKA